MPRFFVNSSDIQGDFITISGDDASHITKSLRMKAGQSVTVCDTRNTDYICTISEIGAGSVFLHIESRERTQSEPHVSVTLYQGYPKGDKLEFITEKAVELGAMEVVPVVTARSVARPDRKSAEKKHERLCRHALEAAKQCGRGIIPKISLPVKFSAIGDLLGRHDLLIFCYEGGGRPLSKVMGGSSASDIGVIIGPEGGFDPSEAETLASLGAVTVSLGSRILRTETAALAALTAVMFARGEM
ncbi:MAG: 16S rRNA (uracil(1498)-N(3))-methyltransferase [Oscillospiraceae bacterium]|jgi:16S rRNA (uracil1498-N3)-methyltransferase|nr:16S rRNA (uracil(1498)-N(3))-methyltransferase [Oscillospiraceae bacterium]